MELRHSRRAFVNRASGLDHKASIANSCFASDFVDNIQRASAPTFRWIRSSLFYVVLFRLWRLVHRNRSLPCICPLRGILPSNSEPFAPSTLQGRAIPFYAFPAPGFGSGVPLLPSVITRRRCVFGQAVGVHCLYALHVTGATILPGHSARNFPDNTPGGSIVFTSRS